jgi:hypothetical protein
MKPQPSMSSQPWQRERHEQEDRVKEREYFPLLCFGNVWYPSFFNHRNLAGKDDVPAVKVLKGLGGIEDELAIFLQVF